MTSSTLSIALFPPPWNAGGEDLIQVPLYLETINSCFGISHDTATLIAESQGVTVSQLAGYALKRLARDLIPDLDLDSPTLSQEQTEALTRQRDELIRRRSSNETVGARLRRALLESEGLADLDDHAPK